MLRSVSSLASVDSIERRYVFIHHEQQWALWTLNKVLTELGDAQLLRVTPRGPIEKETTQIGTHTKQMLSEDE